jgi:hypothetical protein
MALLWVDGFEGYGETVDGSPAPTGVLQRKYSVTAGTTTMLTKAGRYGGMCIYFGGSTNSLFTASLTTHDTLIAGCGWYNNNAGDCAILTFADTGTYGMWVRKKSGVGELELMRGAAVVDTTSGLGLSLSTWYYVEMKIKCHDSTGTYEVKVGGSTVLSATGVDTKISSNNYHDSAGFRPVASRAPNYDDFYICDGSGAINNDFLGDCKIVRIDPNGDDTANWSTSTPSANHYENVDEVETDDNTSYIEETTTNTTDLFDYENVSGLSSIKGVQICTECRETDANSYSIKTPIESGGNQYDDSAQTIGTPNYVTKVRVAGTDPDTGALWTESGLNAAKFGVKVG